MAEDSSGVTLDAFHRGGFWIWQPSGRGHRAGMDALILSAAVPGGFSGLAADLGSGAGAAGMSLAARCGDSRVLLVERDGQMVELSRQSLDLEQNTHLKDRVSVLQADVSLSGKARVSAGLADRSFDFAIMNPPFNDHADRQSPDPLRRDAHVMVDGLLETWIRTASAILKPGGSMAMIARPVSLGAILQACEKRFGGLELKPVQPDPQKSAIRLVVRGIRGSRAPLSIHPPLVMHEAGSREFSAFADAVCNGQASLFGD